MAIMDLRMNPSQRELRWFGAILPLFFALIGALVLWHFEALGISAGIWISGGLVSLAFLAVRALRLPIYRGWLRLFYPIGWVVSHLALATVYFLVVTPIGLLARLVGHDPMQRRFERAASSYWVRHPPAGAPERYFRQY